MDSTVCVITPFSRWITITIVVNTLEGILILRDRAIKRIVSVRPSVHCCNRIPSLKRDTESSLSSQSLSRHRNYWQGHHLRSHLHQGQGSILLLGALLLEDEPRDAVITSTSAVYPSKSASVCSCQHASYWPIGTVHIIACVIGIRGVGRIVVVRIAVIKGTDSTD